VNEGVNKAVILRPSVAVIVTVFNDGRFLEESVGSAIDLQLASREFADVSIVLADDGSTETRTVQVLDRLECRGLRVLRCPHRGPGALRNAAIRTLAADWFIPLDADNRLHPSMLRTLLPAGEASPQAGLVYGDAMRFGTEHGRWRMGPTDVDRLWRENHIDNCGLIRSSAWRSVGGYTEDIVGLEDWDLWLRFIEAQFELVYVSELVFDYRVRADSLIRSRLRVSTREPTPLTHRAPHDEVTDLGLAAR
jgi:glycosyltransferase involved in cell wall biosynthesis